MSAAALCTPKKENGSASCSPLSASVASTPKTPKLNLPPPVPAAQRPAPPPIKSANGLVVEFLKHRLYLASYTNRPTSATVIPFPAKEERRKISMLSPVRRNSPTKLPRTKLSTSSKARPPIFFTIDDCLFYNKFHLDFGPMNVGHLWRFACCLHELMDARENKNRQIVFWSRPDPKSRANAACLMTSFLVMCHNWSPHMAIAPIAQLDPPLMPFRDAGYSQADFIITVQDVLYGLWKAKEARLIGLKYFDINEYEKFERVDQGDFNWISPDFVAFASPIWPPPPAPKKNEHGELQRHMQYTEAFFARYRPKDGLGKDGRGFPTNLQELKECKISESFRNVLEHFYEHDVGLVVRLNEHLYPANYFTYLGMTHLDMIFDDGTPPSLPTLRTFINLAHETITVKKKKVAVHCKAGLGRTGCLIGAYLIYRYGFSATECIAYMRIMRPGMVVGNQQHWLQITQDTIRQWAFEDRYLEEREQLLTEMQFLKNMQQNSRHKLSIGNAIDSTPPPRRSILGDIAYNEVSPEHLPAPTPGQPRKNSARFFSPNKYNTEQENDTREYVDGIRVDTDEDDNDTLDAEEMSEEELHLRVTAKRLSSRSPKEAKSNKKRRSVSYTLTSATQTTHTTTTTTSSNAAARISGERTPPHMIGSSTIAAVSKSGNGVTTAKARNPARRMGAINATREGRIRKVSGRIVSGGLSAQATSGTTYQND